MPQLLINVSYKDVVKPLEDGGSESEWDAEVRSIMEVLEQRLIAHDPAATYFGVDYPVDQEQMYAFCEVYDQEGDDIVTLILTYE